MTLDALYVYIMQSEILHAIEPYVGHAPVISNIIASFLSYDIWVDTHCDLMWLISYNCDENNTSFDFLVTSPTSDSIRVYKRNQKVLLARYNDGKQIMKVTQRWDDDEKRSITVDTHYQFHLHSTKHLYLEHEIGFMIDYDVNPGKTRVVEYELTNITSRKGLQQLLESINTYMCIREESDEYIGATHDILYLGQRFPFGIYNYDEEDTNPVLNDYIRPMKCFYKFIEHKHN